MFKLTPVIRVDLPSVHMAGSNAHHTAHLEVGPHGFALFLAPDAEFPILDINGTAEQLDEVIEAIHDALAHQRAEPAAEFDRPHRGG